MAASDGRMGALPVIEKGQVVETGDHDSLVKARGLYARLAQSQDLEAETPA